jgi:CHAD domain-containing protein
VCVVLAGALDERRQIFLRQLVRVRRRASEPAIHDLRVATRRLIAVIGLIECIVEVPALGKRHRNLRSFLKGFNDLRDTHIQVIMLMGIRRSFPASNLLLQDLRRREQELLRRSGRAVRAFDNESLACAAAEAEEALSGISQHSTRLSAAEAMLRGELGGIFARVAKRREAVNASDPVTIHRMRVAFKKYRYALEILSPLLPWMNETMRKKLNAYQTAMGSIQDVIVVLGGLSAFEAKRPATGRMTFFTLRQHLLSRRQMLVSTFLTEADALYSYWR